MTFATTMEAAIQDRIVYDPARDGIDADPLKINWSAKTYQIPTGDVLGVYKVPGTSLYRIGFAEKTASARVIPEILRGLYTTPTAAQDSIMRSMRAMWDEAERKAPKQRDEVNAASAGK